MQYSTTTTNMSGRNNATAAAKAAKAAADKEKKAAARAEALQAEETTKPAKRARVTDEVLTQEPTAPVIDTAVLDRATAAEAEAVALKHQLAMAQLAIKHEQAMMAMKDDTLKKVSEVYEAHVTTLRDSNADRAASVAQKDARLEQITDKVLGVLQSTTDALKARPGCGTSLIPIQPAAAQPARMAITEDQTQPYEPSDHGQPIVKPRSSKKARSNTTTESELPKLAVPLSKAAMKRLKAKAANEDKKPAAPKRVAKRLLEKMNAFLQALLEGNVAYPTATIEAAKQALHLSYYLNRDGLYWRTMNGNKAAGFGADTKDDDVLAQLLKFFLDPHSRNEAYRATSTQDEIKTQDDRDNKTKSELFTDMGRYYGEDSNICEIMGRKEKKSNKVTLIEGLLQQAIDACVPGDWAKDVKVTPMADTKATPAPFYLRIDENVYMVFPTMGELLVHLITRSDKRDAVIDLVKKLCLIPSFEPTAAEGIAIEEADQVRLAQKAVKPPAKKARQAAKRAEDALVREPSDTTVATVATEDEFTRQDAAGQGLPASPQKPSTLAGIAAAPLSEIRHAPLSEILHAIQNRPAFSPSDDALDLLLENDQSQEVAASPPKRARLSPTTSPRGSPSMLAGRTPTPCPPFEFGF